MLFPSMSKLPRGRYLFLIISAIVGYLCLAFKTIGTTKEDCTTCVISPGDTVLLGDSPSVFFGNQNTLQVVTDRDYLFGDFTIEGECYIPAEAVVAIIGPPCNWYVFWFYVVTVIIVSAAAIVLILYLFATFIGCDTHLGRFLDNPNT